MIVVADPQWAEATLAAGELPCPHCGGVLRAWAYGRTPTRAWPARPGPSPTRPVRLLRRTQILLPGDLLPRRADATAVVGTALIAKAGGKGHRRIAADLHRPVSTVRRWLRAARSPAHLEWIRRRANERIFRIDPETLNRIIPASGPLGDALTALAASVDAVRRCHPDITAGAWALNRRPHPRTAPPPGTLRLNSTPSRAPARPRPAVTLQTAGRRHADATASAQQ